MKTSKLEKLRRELKKAEAREKIAIEVNDILYLGPGQNGCPIGYLPSPKDYRQANLEVHKANEARINAYFALKDELLKISII